MARQRRLGRGLDSLIGSGPSPTTELQTEGDPSVVGLPPPPAAAQEAAPAEAAGVPLDLPVARIVPNPYQPRQDFDESGLEELTRSIAANGIIQPLVVRRRADGGYELVAGERRLRAAVALGLEKVPAVVRDVPDDRMLEFALVENIQRADLNPIEKAEAFREFLSRLALTQEQASERIGIDRATLANHLRLLELPVDIQKLVRAGALGMSHARTIAAVADPAIQLDLAKKVVRQGWSVRQLERTVSRLAAPLRTSRSTVRVRSPQAAAMEDELRGIFGTKVRVEEGVKKGTGRIVIEYYSLNDFDRILGIVRR